MFVYLSVHHLFISVEFLMLRAIPSNSEKTLLSLAEIETCTLASINGIHDSPVGRAVNADSRDPRFEISSPTVNSLSTSGNLVETKRKGKKTDKCQSF